MSDANEILLNRTKKQSDRIRAAKERAYKTDEYFKHMELAKQGNVDSQTWVGFIAYHNKRYKTAEKMSRQAAEQGNTVAQVNLAALYSMGYGVSKNPLNEEKWLLRAAKKGRKSAQGFLGKMYYEGKGIKQDLVQAYKWSNLAANQRCEYSRKTKRIMKKEMTDEQIAEGEKLAWEFMLLRNYWNKSIKPITG